MFKSKRCEYCLEVELPNNLFAYCDECRKMISKLADLSFYAKRRKGPTRFVDTMKNLEYIRRDLFGPKGFLRSVDGFKVSERRIGQ